MDPKSSSTRNPDIDLSDAITTDLPLASIHFTGKDNLEILRLDPNGDIYRRGKLIENDKEIVDGLRELLRDNGY